MFSTFCTKSGWPAKDGSLRAVWVNLLFPRQGVQRNRVDKLVEGVGHGADGGEEREALGAQLEGQDFCRVRHGKRGPGDGVEGVIAEGDGLAGRCDFVFGGWKERT